MNAAHTIKHWKCVARDEGAKAARFSRRLTHEKAFWGIVMIIGTLALLFALIVLFADKLPAIDYQQPLMYGTFH